MKSIEKRKILIAEDEKPMARALEAKLLRSDFDVRVAYDGEEALEILKNDPCDLIILDIMMPKKNGFEVLEELKKEKSKIPVIISSNLGQDNDIKTALELGAKGYFVKSETPIMEIVKIVQKTLS